MAFSVLVLRNCLNMQLVRSFFLKHRYIYWTRLHAWLETGESTLGPLGAFAPTEIFWEKKTPFIVEVIQTRLLHFAPTEIYKY